jgi:Right handed beta helix region
MSRLMLSCGWLCAIVLGVAAQPAQAQLKNEVSYVSNTGSDANNCTLPATACLTIEVALTKTQNYGAVVCLNVGLYGGDILIGQSVTIDCAVTAGTSFGFITVNGPGIVVRLRNLTISRAGAFGWGVDAQNMAALFIENCVISDMKAVNQTGSTYLGIKFEPSAPQSQLFVTNTIISDNGFLDQGAGGGIEIIPQNGGSAGVTLQNVKLEGNVTGITLNASNGAIIAVMRDSTVSGNYLNGILSIGSHPISLLIDNSTIVDNAGTGVVSQGSASTVIIGRSTITGNTTGVASVSGGVLQSYKNNQIVGNGTDGTPIMAVAAGLQ